MEDFLLEIEQCCKEGKHYAALFCSLAIPDICGAAESKDGMASAIKYANWFDKYVAVQGYSDYFSGEQCYRLRCGALHQGLTTHHKLGYERIIFVIKKPGVHLNILNNALNIDLVTFCFDIVTGARTWLQIEAENPDVLRNLPNHLCFYYKGLGVYIEGAGLLT